ncbi:putative ABC transporter ATPase and permease protein [Actinoplanes missouriensis 431]|uniref:Putative ABC transporter ATPase and permease protein n=1 Tax=Actinoplanes missouriensis (strain ATCC 14538 / DSM 43046 / CBS 188.64 / JCM 3121 / NBRC 102363 / NCIMB 12654 / NRRL B-3342 / UNCC 431) TaxID=512565 RepID=I0H3U2_ACTM4|nr:dipeptide/oligopeptide/nickel ABC transporter permease/ATP-binding protein [Actinoplanes missouriensis]BAL87679.1 putative ABC transporter ATPase and permease protein [Actinoplanes missouriensis 431]
MIDAIRRLPVTAKICLGFLLLVVAVAIAAPWLVRHDPTQVALAAPSTGPNGDYWFGVDRLGRDIYSRLVAGTPRSLIVGFGSAGLALLVGAVLGAVAATSRKAVDETVMRLLDIVMAFPTIVLAAILVVAYGNDSLTVLVGAIGFVLIPQIARLVRANVAAQYQEDYVAAERVIGAGRRHILLRHVARNCAAPILVYATIMVANAIVFEASLSFIGGGLQAEAGPSSWGSVIAYGQQLLASGGWWATFFPGLLILLTVLCLNILAEGISDAWAAPATRRRSGAGPADFEPAGGDEPVTALPGLGEAAARLAAAARPPVTEAPILSVRDLRVGFAASHRGVDIVDGISFDVRPGEVLGLIGESGCGKSLTALTVMGLQPRGARVGGTIGFGDADLLTMSAAQRRQVMGRRISMIYQDALSALNPSMTVRAQLKQVIRRGGVRTAEELMTLVGLDPGRTLPSYPHELSGGQRQRVVIAMALARDPELVVADEPTTALDVTVQAQVIQLLLRLRAELGFALILVSHDLALVSDVCDRIAVMYGGRIVEEGRTADVLAAPTHHYTRGLLGSVLSLEAQAPRLVQIRGTVPSPADFPAGCRFADRCPRATRVCADERPPLADVNGHPAACHHPALVLEVTRHD